MNTFGLLGLPIIGIAVMVVALLFTLGLSALIIWLVWRAVKKSVSAPPAPPLVQQKSRWWIWLLALLALPILGITLLALLIFFIRAPARVPALPTTVPLVLNLEIRNPTTNILERVNLAAGQRAFTDIIRLPHASYTVAGAVGQGRGGRYTLDVTVRNHPDNTSSVGINTGSAGIRKPVTVGVPYWVGKLQEDEFRVTLSRDGDPAASPVTKVMGLKPVLWILLAVVIAGVVWAVKRTGHRAACLGTSFLATSGLLFAVFLARVIWIFHRNAQRLEALDADSLASGIASTLGIALLAFVLFVVGAIFAGLALFKYRYRARWFYRVVVTAGILMLFAFPVGTVAGVMLLVYVSKRRAEFGSEQPGAATPPAAPPLAQQQSRWWIWLLLVPVVVVLVIGALWVLLRLR